MQSEEEKTVELKKAPAGGDEPRIEEESHFKDTVKEEAKVVEETEEEKAKKEEELKVKIQQQLKKQQEELQAAEALR